MTLLNKLSDLASSNIYPFHMPGHKRRLFPVSNLEDMYRIDITEIDGFDNLHDAKDIILAEEQRAAKLYNADETHFLVNGTTAGILAAICGTVREGDRIYVARNCHKSVYNAIMLSGAQPVYIYPEQEAYFEINAGITARQVEDIIDSDTGRTKRSLCVITSPTYEGIVSDIEGIAKVCHEKGVQLLVDAAHGAHFGFTDFFPKSAVTLGADIVINSIHKTLPAPTGTALIHINKSCSSAVRVRQMLKVFQTSSPSYPLMAGMAGCIQYLTDNATKAFEDYSIQLDSFYAKADNFTNLSVLTKDKLSCEGSIDYDKGKIVVSDKSRTMTGKQLYDLILSKYNLQPEMAAGDYVLFMTSIADDAEGFSRLITALEEVDLMLSDGSSIQGHKRNIFVRFIDKIITGKVINSIFKSDAIKESYVDSSPVKAQRIHTINDVFWNDTIESVPIELSSGRVSASYVAPYPPGVPLVVPGELITEEIVDKILACINNDLNVNGITDSKEIEVLWEESST